MATYWSHNDTLLSSTKNFCQENKIHAVLSFLFLVSLPLCSPSLWGNVEVYFICFMDLAVSRQFEFIVGGEYSYASLQLLSFSLSQRGTVMYLCCGSKKLNKVNITPTCWRLWTVFHGRVSSLKCTWPFFKSCHARRRAYWCQNGVFLINRPREPRALVFMNWNSSVWTWVRVEIPLTVRCWRALQLQSCVDVYQNVINACMHCIRRNHVIIKVSFLAISCL